MLTFGRRPTYLLLLALTAGCAPGPAGPAGSSAREKGIRDAEAAIAAGRLVVREYPPLPSPAHHGEYIRLLRDRYGIGYEVPARPPGASEADFVQEVGGWNDTMEAEINRRFGAGTLGQLRQEARERWDAGVKARGKG